MSVEMKTTDTREATCPVPATEHDTETLGTWLKRAGEEGYALENAQVIMTGHQRDPYPAGIKLRVKKVDA